MPIGINSPARNLFLLGSSGAQVVSNFFKLIDQTTATENSYRTTGLKYNEVDKKYLLSGMARNINVSPTKEFGWIEKRDETGTADWDVRVESTESGVNTYLNDMELDINDNLTVVGKTGDVPWIAKYSNGGAIDWQSTSNTADLEYFGVTSDSNGQYYACGANYAAPGPAVAFVEKFDANGNPGWGKAAFILEREVALLKIAANNRGEVVAVGYIEDDTYIYRGYIVKIDTNTGEVLWDRTLSYYGEGVFLENVTIDSKDQIYIVGDVGDNQFIVKYTAEGNLLWQSQTDVSPSGLYPRLYSQALTVNDVTESVTTIGRVYNSSTFKHNLLLSNYDRKGKLIWRRIVSQGSNVGMGYETIDNEGAFIYIAFKPQVNFSDSKYTYGKVSATGNGLGDFQYDDGDTATLIDYEYVSSGELQNDVIGRLSDGSVRNDTSDLLTYPFNANKLLFDDLATQVSNKKRQIDTSDFEYSGSPAIRPVDFPIFSLDTSNFNSSTVAIEDPRNNVTAEFSTFEGPFPGTTALKTTGINSGVQISNTYGGVVEPADGPGTGPYTLETFIYVSAYPTSGYMNVMGISFPYNPSVTYDTLVMDSAGTLYYSPSNGSLLSNPNTVPLNQWVHLAITRNGNLRSVYIDGVAMLSGYTGGNAADLPYVSLRLGTFWGAYGPFDGYFSNVRYTYQELYTSNFTPPSTAFTFTGNEAVLFCHKKYWYDSLNLNAEAVEGTSQPPTEVQLFTKNHIATPIPLLPTGSIYFDGNSSLSLTPLNVDYSTNLTLEAWINTTSTAGWSQIVCGENGDILWAVNSGKLNFGSQLNTPIPHDNQSTATINTGEWIHVVTTYDGANIKHYINGTLDSTFAETGSLNANEGTYPLRIGSRGTGTGEFMTGYIGDVRIYDRALTAGQVFQNYNASKAKYIAEQAETAPKIGPGIVYDNNLLLNYDFENKATYPSKTFTKTVVNAPTSGNGSEFGMKAVSFGNEIVVGEPWRDNGYIYICRSDGSIRTTIASPTSDGYIGNEFGFRFEADPISNRIVAQVHDYSNNGGKLRVLNGSTGALEVTISHPSPFDGTVAPLNREIGENGLAVGNGKIVASNTDYYKTGTTTRVGQVWVWDIDGTNQIAIPNPDPDNYDEFGSKITIADNKIAITGSRIDYFGDTDTVPHKVWIYDLSGNLIRTLQPPANDSSVGFGWGAYGGCFIGDNRYAVVDDTDEGGGRNSGAVHLYDYDGNFIKKLRPAEVNSGTTFRFFGYTGQQYNVGVTIKNQKIYVATGEVSRITAPPSIDIFDINGNYEKKLIGPPGDWIYAGFTVLDNDTIVVSDTSLPNNNYDGGMYIYSTNNVKNLSSSSYTGTINGPTFNSAGYFEFDGNDEISVTGAQSTGNFTQEGWIKTTNTGNYNTIISWGVHSPQQDRTLWTLPSSGVAALYFYGTGDNMISGTSNVADNEWHHIVGTWDGTTGRVYVDGVLENSGSLTAGAYTYTNTFIGKNVGGSYYQNGFIGEARIYNRALSSTEVSQNFNATRSKYGV
ncbi:hypothetical protein [Synechococcus phage S-H9-2]|uniref:LamG-like jellyroll fold domain-containing protein n=1 Tax=Synechococcus phage S-H9-2 TaxID=2783669 RepID=A0A873WE12_9CAUD|nr:hypothetical protein PQC10_gp187 [Synechococcus phage S-H9-2]QPB08403.1 hypothetical protein [Synechococcus phage S-H9-2]